MVKYRSCRRFGAGRYRGAILPGQVYSQRLAHSVAVLLLLLLFSATADAASIIAIDVRDSSVTLRFDQPVATASAFMLVGPQRIAVDLPGARMSRASHC